MPLIIRRFFTSLVASVYRARNHPLRLILIIGLIQGFLYIFLIPPWWHFDEPGHFEFAWQIAHFDHWPQKGEVNEPMRVKLAESLLRYDFYDLVGYQPVLDGSAPVDIPYAPQTTNYPLYYLIASAPLRFLGDIDFAIQVRVLRMVSLAMFLLTLWVTWKALDEILPKGHPVQWMTTLFLALLPGFGDTMTSVNDDVGAILAFSIFIWASLRLIKRGLSLWRCLAVLSGGALCYWTKNTAWPALALTLVVFLLAVFRAKWSWLAWATIAMGTIASLFMFFRWDDPSLWYRGSRQAHEIRVKDADAPLGNYVLSIHGQAENPITIGQFVAISDITPLRQKTVTLGGWIWADRPAEIQLPTLRVTLHGTSEAPSLITLFDNLDSSTKEFLSSSTCSACMGQIKTTLEEKAAAATEPWVVSPSQTVTLTTTPTFYSVTFQLVADAESGWIELIPFPNGGLSDSIVYFDGLVMSDGKRTGEPKFDSLLATSGMWNGKPFHNLVRNASAEATWLRFSPLGETIANKIFTAGVPSVFIASLQDWRGTKQYYRGIGSTLFETFWAKTAINKISLVGAPISYRVLLWFTALGLAAAIAIIIRKFKGLPWSLLLFLGMVLVGVWGLTLARGGIEVIKSYGVLPWARYAFPSAIPTALVLCAGWWEALRWLGKWIGISPASQARGFVAFIASVNILAILSIMRYFYWKSEQEYLILFVVVLAAAYFGIQMLDQKTSIPVETNGNRRD